MDIFCVCILPTHPYFCHWPHLDCWQYVHIPFSTFNHGVSWSNGKKIVFHYSQYLTKTIWSNNKPCKQPKQESTGLSTLEKVLSAVWIEMENSLDCAQLSAWAKNWPVCSISLSYKLVFCLFQGYYRSSNALSQLRNTLNNTILSTQGKNWQKWLFWSPFISETWFSFRFTFRS